MTFDPAPHSLLRVPRLLWLASLLVAAPAHAQYKVTEPDGRVTYTDRLPTGQAKVTPLGARAATGAVISSGDAALPLELRQSATRYPVTLYVVTGTCTPCDSARHLLRQRGIPFSEKTVMSAEDTEALERLTGGRDAPTLMIGSQTLRGLAPEVWGSYLDAAGYPRESRLPANYQSAPATPLTERRDATIARSPAARASQPGSDEPPATPPPPPSPTGIKF